jgi:exonuclease III
MDTYFSFNLLCPLFTLRINVWNFNETKTDSKQLRKHIIENFDSDIFGLCETYLKNDNGMYMPGFTWYGNNRQHFSCRAVRGSGGVGILVKNELLNDYFATVLDKSYEGIFWLRLTSKYDNSFYINICIAYLIPESSII